MTCEKRERGCVSTFPINQPVEFVFRAETDDDDQRFVGRKKKKKRKKKNEEKKN
jgi:hypothetical protein